jgi:hypothetical protein
MWDYFQALPGVWRANHTVYRLRNSGDRRSASATRLVVPQAMAVPTTGGPPARTRKTEAPGDLAMEMFAQASGLLRTVTSPSPPYSTVYVVPSLRPSTVTSSPGVTFLRGTLTFGMAKCYYRLA